MSSDAMLKQLQNLVTVISNDTGIRVELHPNRWAYDPARKALMVAEDDLEKHGVKACVGIIYHEVSHFYITRYLELMDTIEFPSHKALANLLNAIEDTRIENWIQTRYPGSQEMLDESSSLHAREKDGLTELIPFEQFLLGCIIEWHDDWDPLSHEVTQEVMEALDQTRDARIRFHQKMPPASLELSRTRRETRELHDQLVLPRLKGGVSRNPALKEMQIRISQMEALMIAENGIIPSAKKLLEADIDSLNQAVENCEISEAEIRENQDGDLPSKLREVIIGNPSASPCSGDPSEICKKGIDIIIGCPPPNLTGIDSPLVTEGLDRNPALAPTMESGEMRPDVEWERKPVPAIKRPAIRRTPINREYESRLDKVSDQIERLANALEEELIPRKRMRTTSGHASGPRVDVGRLMEYAARPELYLKIWQRRTLPDRRDSAFLLLLDLSGSMEGRKFEHAVLGTILLAETLSRLRISFSIVGFQDVLIDVFDFDDTFGDSSRQAILDMELELSDEGEGQNCEPGYNDDGPCLLEAAELLMQRAEEERFLIVISDGEPAGIRSTEEDLHDAVNRLSGPKGEGIQIIGLGLGPGTGHVEEFYPNNIANIELDDFADEISRVLGDILIQRVLS